MSGGSWSFSDLDHPAPHHSTDHGRGIHEMNTSHPIQESNHILMWNGNTTEADLLAVTMLLTGPIVLFYGYKTFRPTLAICAALLSAFSCYILVSTYTTFTLSMEYIVVFTAGLAGALAALTVTDLGIFLLGAVFGGLISNIAFHTVYARLNIPNDDYLIRCLLLLSCCLICGLLALYCLRLLLRVYTALVGSYMLTAALSHFALRVGLFPTSPFAPQFFFNSPDRFQCTGLGTEILAVCYGFACFWGVMFVCGLVLQCSTTGRDYSKDYEELMMMERERRFRQEQYGLLTDRPVVERDYQSTGTTRPIQQHVV